MTQYILYSGQHCHLCDLALELIQQVSPDISQQLKKVDVKTTHELYHQYGARIPVLKIENGARSKELGWPFDQQRLQEFLV